MNTAIRTALDEGEEAAMPSCPECESELDLELDEVEEGDVIACEECGTEYEVVGVEPLELARVDEELDEDGEVYGEEEEEE
jgi:alpha-aminoadipate/glutamate carrier protein LysW